VSKDDAQSKLLSFLLDLQNRGYKERTIKDYGKKLGYLAKRTNLLDPEAFKEWLAKAKISEMSKHLFVSRMKVFYEFLVIPWIPPGYKEERRIPFVPTEAELDILIASMPRKTAALLQLLKDAGMRLGEALSLRWTDVTSSVGS
jgi:integrase